MTLLKLIKLYGFLQKPCISCGQQFIVARSGKKCYNCG